jgi:hypothetical protein
MGAGEPRLSDILYVIATMTWRMADPVYFPGLDGVHLA